MYLKQFPDNRRPVRVSICLASYNGAQYIEEQLESILVQISIDDEVIIVDDCSKDDTLEIISRLADRDNRIVLLANQKNLGVNKSFEKAISQACGEYIFMADQDDVWEQDRLQKMLDELESGVQLVSGNTVAIGTDGNSIDFHLGLLQTGDSEDYARNIWRIFLGRAYYYGCAMAFRKKMKDIILPFPEYLESHDLWIAMAANQLKSNKHIDAIVLRRRIHGNNASVVDRKLKQKLYSRYVFMRSYFELRKRITKKKGE